MANILAAGTSLADSTEFTLAAGESATLLMIGSDYPEQRCAADIQMQTSGSLWQTIGQLRFVAGECSKVLTAVGTFRVQRRACPKAVGIDQT